MRLHNIIKAYYTYRCNANTILNPIWKHYFLRIFKISNVVFPTIWKAFNDTNLLSVTKNAVECVCVIGHECSNFSEFLWRIANNQVLFADVKGVRFAEFANSSVDTLFQFCIACFIQRNSCYYIASFPFWAPFCGRVKIKMSFTLLSRVSISSSFCLRLRIVIYDLTWHFLLNWNTTNLQYKKRDSIFFGAVMQNCRISPA